MEVHVRALGAGGHAGVLLMVFSWFRWLSGLASLFCLEWRGAGFVAWAVSGFVGRLFGAVRF